MDLRVGNGMVDSVSALRVGSASRRIARGTNHAPGKPPARIRCAGIGAK